MTPFLGSLVVKGDEYSQVTQVSETGAIRPDLKLRFLSRLNPQGSRLRQFFEMQSCS
jgi:hypothetical protein